MVAPVAYGIALAVCAPSFVLRPCGVTTFDVEVPVVDSAVVAKVPTPFCVVVQSIIEKTMVSIELPLVTRPCGREPSKYRLPPVTPAVVASSSI